MLLSLHFLISISCVAIGRSGLGGGLRSAGCHFRSVFFLDIHTGGSFGVLGHRIRRARQGQSALPASSPDSTAHRHRARGRHRHFFKVSNTNASFSAAPVRGKKTGTATGVSSGVICCFANQNSSTYQSKKTGGDSCVIKKSSLRSVKGTLSDCFVFKKCICVHAILNTNVGDIF